MSSAENIGQEPKKRGANMDIFSFCKWFWERYFKHIEELELTAAKNWRELCLTKIKEMDKRLADNGIT